ncbi:hypothetical protein JCM8097_008325 [Rhodosporidiobolus ruineniae]
MHRYAAPAAPRGPPRTPKVDREKTCPSLLRVFVKPNAHHPDTDFSTTSLPTQDEHQLYTWRDTTLREILLLLRDAAPALRAAPLARYSLRLVFWDADHDRFTSEELAVIAAKDLLTPPGSSAAAASRGVYTNPRLDRTLADAKFVVGDLLDVAYLGASVEVAPAVPPPGPVGFGNQYAAPPHLRGGPPPPQFGLGRGGFAGAPGGPRGGPAGGRRDDTWAPVPLRGGPGGPPRGRGGFAGRAHDQGWGRRASGAERDSRPPPPRRRDSRSLSPGRDQPRRRSPSRSRSPPPQPRRDQREDDMDTRE